jgi:hypothetical protein
MDENFQNFENFQILESAPKSLWQTQDLNTKILN